jgi:hypothetical protein
MRSERGSVQRPTEKPNDDPVTGNQVNELHLSMLCGMVGTAGEWAGFDMGKAHG